MVTVPFRLTARPSQHDTAVNDPGVSDAAASFEVPHHLILDPVQRRSIEAVKISSRVYASD